MHETIEQRINHFITTERRQSFDRPETDFFISILGIVQELR